MQPSAIRLTFNPVFPKRLYSIGVVLSSPCQVPLRREVTSTVADRDRLLRHGQEDEGSTLDAVDDAHCG
jgi:hypothetical protein